MSPRARASLLNFAIPVSHAERTPFLHKYYLSLKFWFNIGGVGLVLINGLLVVHLLAHTLILYSYWIWTWIWCSYFLSCISAFVCCLNEKRFMYEDKVKSSRPSLRETWDKRPLGSHPDRSWCHRHASVKLFWSQPMSHGHRQQHTGKVKNSRPSVQPTWNSGQEAIG